MTCPICSKPFDQCDYFQSLEDEPMSTRRFCDRCKNPIPVWDEMLQDTIDREYQGQDICPNCDGQIKTSEAVARQAAITGKSHAQIAKEWLNQYQ